MTHKRNMRVTASILVLMLILLASAGCGTTNSAANSNNQSPASNSSEKPTEQAINMRLSTAFPAENFMSKIDQEFVQKVEVDSKSRIKITPYWGGTLANPAKWYDELVGGATDIVQGTPGTDGGHLPINNASAYYTYGITNIDAMRKIGTEIWETTPALQAEYKEVKPLIWFSIGQVWVHTTKRPINTVADFKGLTLRVADDQAFALVKALGSNPVRIPMSETYTALEKGTIDGILIGVDALKSFKIAEVTKYSTALPYITSWQATRFININVWNKLSPDLQKVINDNSRWWETRFLEDLAKQSKEGIELAKQRGNKITELPKAENEKITSLLEENAKKIVQNTSSTEIFDKSRKLVEKYKQ